ncbi:hypothetical protein [Pantoea sp. BAV 3049]|uniref:hypothetical protein n=1 Tax=Pantoea sp. BAV 3049 TaxID=2654188 RepID=UPI00131D5911|nr:hypothetical protein [Pantoea sp. BAV 3049]
MNEVSANEKKLRFYACLPAAHPYNAPPSNGNEQALSVLKDEEEIPEKMGLTLKEESVIYATSRQAATLRRTAL